MTEIAPETGIALSCDPQGVVLQVIRDSLGLASRIPAGTPLRVLAAEGAEEKIDLFLAELRTHQAVFDWEITVLVGPTLRVLHFAGARLPEGLLIVAAPSRYDLIHLHEQLALINNEQANIVRATAKEMALAAQSPRAREDSVYDDLGRLNNEMANLQRTLAKQNADLAALNSQKNRLLGMAAHDLRNPLGVILAYSEFLESEAFDKLDEEQQEFVSTIKEMSQFMLKLVTDLLDVTAIEAGQLILHRKDCDLASLIGHSVTLNGVLAAKKQITVALVVDGPVPPLSLDVGKIEQVLNNLISNAIKFSHPNTHVEVRVGVRGPQIEVAVQDQGQGIPQSEMAKLFKPFGRASVQSTAGEQSTGLGLAIVRRIIEGHGGRIWVESTVDQGSTFTFSLPGAAE